MYRRTILATVVALVVLAQSGCKWDPKQFNEASGMLNRAIEVLEDASKSWQLRLSEVSKILDNRFVDLTTMLREISDEIKDLPKETIEFVLALVKAQGQVLLEELKKTRDSLQNEVSANGKIDDGVITTALSKLASTKVFLDPVITRFSPETFKVEWQDYLQSQCTVSTNEITLQGWGFEQSKDEEPRIKVQLRDKTQKTILAELPWSSSGRYKLKVSLDANPDQWKQSYWLVFHDEQSKSNDQAVLIGHRVPPKPDVFSASQLTLSYALSKYKHENYCIRTVVVNSRTNSKIIERTDYPEGQKARLEGSNALFNVPIGKDLVMPGDRLTVTMTSVHMGPAFPTNPPRSFHGQFDGRWAGTFTVTCTFTNWNDVSKDFTVTSPASPFVDFEHEGGFFGANYVFRERSFDLVVPGKK